MNKSKLKWCKLCVLPSSRPNLKINEKGICNACLNHKKKIKINWKLRLKKLKHLINWAKSKKSNYDCIIPVSGGKDSTWQVLKCLNLGLKPLAVTWRPQSRTEIGQKNLDNLISLGVDHLDCTVNPRLEKKLVLQLLKKKGSTAITMHLGIFNIPLKLANSLKIPLIIWGENPADEYGAKNYKDIDSDFNYNIFKTYGVTNNTTLNEIKSLGFKDKDLYLYKNEFIKKTFVKQIFLGQYLRWDPYKINKVSKKVGFKSLKMAKTGYYNYADIDDNFISIHHWLKWYKFGFTRIFDNLSIEIRNGRLSRKKALKIIKNNQKPPSNDISKFCNYVGISKEEFFKIVEKFRNKKIWKKNKKGIWFIENFII